MAFVCLNASGVACLAYCETFDVTAETEHCPLKRLSEDCDKTSVDHANSISVNGHAMDCCQLAVSFFAPPVEQKSFSFDSPSEGVPQRFAAVQPNFTLADTFDITFDYRGPPPLDRRGNRLKNRIFRI